MWTHLPGEREPSVHRAAFPDLEDLQVWHDPALVARWRRLIDVRDAVNAALEAKRQDKTIGTSLGARVVVRAGGETAQLLASMRDELSMLFIVSNATLDPSGPADGPIDVTVEKAQGDKCPRCWRIVPSTDQATGLCDRCTAALRPQTDAVAH
jgi:isoleucyl-tRNA synthetase